MKRTIKLFFVIFLGLTFLACATGKEATAPPEGGAPAGAAPQAQAGAGGPQAKAVPPATAEEMGGARNFLGQYYNMMGPGPSGGVEKRWLKPGVNFGKYNKIMIESVVFYLAKDSDYQGIDPEAMKELADKFDKILADKLKDRYPVVTTPGPDVLLIRPAITDLEQSRPVLSGVTSVVPIGLGISIIKRGTMGSWTGSGETGGAMMAVDSTTNDVVAVAEDKQHAGFTERFSKWGSAEDAFNFWAERMRKFLDEAHGATG